MDQELQQALANLGGESKRIFTDLARRLDSAEHKATAMQIQLDSQDVARADKHYAGPAGKSIAETIFEDAGFKALAENGGKGRAVIRIPDFGKKALSITSAGISTSGVLEIDRVPGIVGVQFRPLRIRDLLRSAPTTEAAVDYVKVSVFVNNASPQNETLAKSQSDMTLTTVSSVVRTVAHWIRASKQILSDLPGLTDTVNSHLIYGLKLKEEMQLLSGDNTGQNLYGIIPQAAPFDISLLSASAGYQRLDIIGAAIQQAERTDYTCDIVVLNTDDFWKMARTKDSQGRYLFGDPAASTVPTIWGRPIAVSNSITSGTFLTGSSQTALIRDRMDAIVEVSENVNDDFLTNQVVLRCEERLCLQVMRPAAWITGTFVTSPAS